MFRRSGSVSRDTAQEVERGFLDSVGVFNGFEVDALQRSSGAPSMLIFWSSSKSRSGEAGSHLDVDEAGCGKVGFHGLVGLSFT